MIDQYKLVPVEPTPEMLKAANCMIDCDPIWMARAYRAMIAAAPKHPSSPSRQGISWCPLSSLRRILQGYGFGARNHFHYAHERAHGIGEKT